MNSDPRVIPALQTAGIHPRASGTSPGSVICRWLSPGYHEIECLASANLDYHTFCNTSRTKRNQKMYCALYMREHVPMFPLNIPCAHREIIRIQKFRPSPNEVIASASPSGPRSNTGRLPTRSESRPQWYTQRHSEKKKMDSYS